jgi:hypothetical protein
MSVTCTTGGLSSFPELSSQVEPVFQYYNSDQLMVYQIVQVMEIDNSTDFLVLTF